MNNLEEEEKEGGCMSEGSGVEGEPEGICGSSESESDVDCNMGSSSESSEVSSSDTQVGQNYLPLNDPPEKITVDLSKMVVAHSDASLTTGSKGVAGFAVIIVKASVQGRTWKPQDIIRCYMSKQYEAAATTINVQEAMGVRKAVDILAQQRRKATIICCDSKLVVDLLNEDAVSDNDRLVKIIVDIKTEVKKAKVKGQAFDFVKFVHRPRDGMTAVDMMARAARDGFGKRGGETEGLPPVQSLNPSIHISDDRPRLPPPFSNVSYACDQRTLLKKVNADMRKAKKSIVDISSDFELQAAPKSMKSLRSRVDSNMLDSSSLAAFKMSKGKAVSLYSVLYRALNNAFRPESLKHMIQEKVRNLYPNENLNSSISCSRALEAAFLLFPSLKKKRFPILVTCPMGTWQNINNERSPPTDNFTPRLSDTKIYSILNLNPNPMSLERKDSDMVWVILSKITESNVAFSYNPLLDSSFDDKRIGVDGYKEMNPNAVADTMVHRAACFLSEVPNITGSLNGSEAKALAPIYQLYVKKVTKALTPDKNGKIDRKKAERHAISLSSLVLAVLFDPFGKKKVKRRILRRLELCRIMDPFLVLAQSVQMDKVRRARNQERARFSSKDRSEENELFYKEVSEERKFSKIQKKILHFCSASEVKRAVNIIDSNGEGASIRLSVAEAKEELEMKHLKHRSLSEINEVEPMCTDGEIPEFYPSDLMDYLRRKKQATPGLDACGRDFLLDLIIMSKKGEDDKALPLAICELANTFIKGGFVPVIMTVSKVFLLEKAKGGFRVINLQSVIYAFTDSMVNRDVARRWSQMPNHDNQYAISRPNGGQLAGLLTWADLGMDGLAGRPPLLITSIDFKKAFNNIDRLMITKEWASLFGEYLPYVKSQLGRPSLAVGDGHVMYASQGVPQGLSTSGLHFAMALQSFLLKNPTGIDTITRAYADDLVVPAYSMAGIENCAKWVKRVERYGPEYGLFVGESSVIAHVGSRTDKVKNSPLFNTNFSKLKKAFPVEQVDVVDVEDSEKDFVFLGVSTSRIANVASKTIEKKCEKALLRLRNIIFFLGKSQPLIALNLIRSSVQSILVFSLRTTMPSAENNKILREYDMKVRGKIYEMLHLPLPSSLQYLDELMKPLHFLYSVPVSMGGLGLIPRSFLHDLAFLAAAYDMKLFNNGYPAIEKCCKMILLNRNLPPSVLESTADSSPSATVSTQASVTKESLRREFVEWKSTLPESHVIHVEALSQPSSYAVLLSWKPVVFSEFVYSFVAYRMALCTNPLATIRSEVSCIHYRRCLENGVGLMDGSSVGSSSSSSSSSSRGVSKDSNLVPCKCGPFFGANTMYRMANCTFFNNHLKTPRHDAVKDVLASLFRRAGFVVHVEEVVQSNPKLRMDLVVDVGDCVFALDLTIRSVKDGQSWKDAVREAVDKKNGDYKSVCERKGWVFVPLVFSHVGAVSDKTKKWFDELKSRASFRKPVSWSKISLAVSGVLANYLGLAVSHTLGWNGGESKSLELPVKRSIKSLKFDNGFRSLYLN